jgi:hypothetical protein
VLEPLSLALALAAARGQPACGVLEFLLLRGRLTGGTPAVARRSHRHGDGRPRLGVRVTVVRLGVGVTVTAELSLTRSAVLRVTVAVTGWQAPNRSSRLGLTTTTTVLVRRRRRPPSPASQVA